MISHRRLIKYFIRGCRMVIFWFCFYFCIYLLEFFWKNFIGCGWICAWIYDYLGKELNCLGKGFLFLKTFYKYCQLALKDVLPICTFSVVTWIKYCLQFVEIMRLKTGILPNVLPCFRFEGFINKPLITHKQF